MKPDYKKIIQVLNYIAEKAGGKIPYMKALKLLYLADRLHLREYGRLITDDKLVAMKYGTLGSQAKNIVTMSEYLPHIVYEFVEDKLKRNDDLSIQTNYKERDELSQTDIECVDKIFSEFGKKTQFELADLTHELPEWKKHEYSIEKEKIKVVKIDVYDLFKPTENKELGKIYSQSEAELELSKDLFSESLEQKALVS